MKCGIIVGGRFPAAYRTAEGLAEAGLDYHVVTSYPAARLPPYRFDRRNMTSYGWLEYAIRGCELWPAFGRLLRLQFVKMAVLDRLAERRLGDCGIVNGWSSKCRNSFIAARKRRAVCLLQTGSAHASVQDLLVRREFERFGMNRAITAPGTIRRQLEEYALADRIVTPSSFVRRSFVDSGVSAEKLLVIPEGVDLANLHPKPKRDTAFRVSYVGHLSLRKGVRYLLEAARLLEAPVDLVLRGESGAEFAPVLRRHRGEYRLATRMAGGDFSDFLSQANVVVVPSVEDGWCAVTIEAMACGVPVIVSANTGSADAVREGRDGFVVPAGDPAAIAGKIEWLRRNPERAAAMGHQARERAGEYSWSAYRTRMAKLIADLASEGGRSESKSLASPAPLGS